MSKKQPKMQPCKACGQTIAASAKACPGCGAKNKKPIFKKWWFWVIIVVILLGAIGSTEDTGTTNDVSEANVSSTSKPSPAPETSSTPSPSPSASASQAPIEYAVYSVDEIMETLESNAMKAESLYDDQYVEITGRLAVIDSDGKYISLFAEKNEWAFTGVQCFIRNKDQKAQVIEMAIDDVVTVRGKITGVGEVLGYTLNIDEIMD